MTLTTSMNRFAFVLTTSAAVCVGFGVLFWGSTVADGQSEEGQIATDPQFDQEGALVRPENYRQWIYVGTPVTPNDMNGGSAAFPEFHSVYINPEAYAHYKETGQFPDGTILLKELVSVGGKQASSGKGYFMGDYLGLEASVKDSQRFADEPGHWAYFSFGKQPNLASSAKAFPAASCNGCHEATASEDWVFTEFYPVLRAAKPAQ